MTVYGFHSLRHSFASFCAEAGVPKAVVVSILGAESDIVDKFYTHVGDAAQEQAIMAISFSGTGKKDNERIAEAFLLHTVLNSLFSPVFRFSICVEIKLYAN